MLKWLTKTFTNRPPRQRVQRPSFVNTTMGKLFFWFIGAFITSAYLTLFESNPITDLPAILKYFYKILKNYFFK